NLEIHRNTWRYNVLLEQHRQLLAGKRDEWLTTDAVEELFAVRCLEKYEKLVEEHGEDLVLNAARAIALYHLDRCWAEHLAYMTDLREGIHLRVLGSQDPLDEFHREAIPAFKRLMLEMDDRAVTQFEELELTGEDWQPADSGMVRPSATWTYVVSDN